MAMNNPIASQSAPAGKKSKDAPQEAPPRSFLTIMKNELVSEFKDLTKDRTGRIIAASTAAGVVAFVTAIGIWVVVWTEKPKKEQTTRKKAQQDEPQEIPRELEARKTPPKTEKPDPEPKAVASDAAEKAPASEVPSKPERTETRKASDRPPVDPETLSEKRNEILTTGQGTVSKPGDAQAIIEVIREMNGQSASRKQKQYTQ